MHLFNYDVLTYCFLFCSIEGKYRVIDGSEIVEFQVWGVRSFLLKSAVRNCINPRPGSPFFFYADSLLRPFERLRLRIFLPLRVLFLFRNPCVLLRFLL
jgi:hypothetical protein